MRDLKSLICLVYQKVDSEAMVLSVFKAKKVEVLMSPLIEKALAIYCLKLKLDKFKEVINFLNSTGN